MIVNKFKRVLPVVALLTVIGCSSQATKINAEDAGKTTAVTATEASKVAKKRLSPEENNKIVVRMYERAWNQGDMKIVDDTISPDGLDHSPLSTEKGTAGFKKIIQSFRAAMPDLKLTIEDMIFNGDKVVHRWRVKGKHTGAPLFGVPASGKEIVLNGISILRLENGKIAERWANLDQLGLLQQLGVVPAPGQKSTGAPKK